MGPPLCGLTPCRACVPAASYKLLLGRRRLCCAGFGLPASLAACTSAAASASPYRAPVCRSPYLPTPPPPHNPPHAPPLSHAAAVLPLLRDPPLTFWWLPPCRKAAARANLTRSKTSTYTTAETTTLEDLSCCLCLGTLRDCVALEPCGARQCCWAQSNLHGRFGGLGFVRRVGDDAIEQVWSRAVRSNLLCLVWRLCLEEEGDRPGLEWMWHRMWSQVDVGSLTRLGGAYERE